MNNGHRNRKDAAIYRIINLHNKISLKAENRTGYKPAEILIEGQNICFSFLLKFLESPFGLFTQLCRCYFALMIKAFYKIMFYRDTFIFSVLNVPDYFSERQNNYFSNQCVADICMSTNYQTPDNLGSSAIVK